MAKITYRKVRKLKPIEAAYIAALIDGEGTVSLVRGNKNTHRELRIEIGNGDFKLLNWVKKLISAGQITLKRPNKKGHSISYVYRIRNRQALNLLSQISSYLKTYKRERAELVLKNYTKLTPRNGKYSPELLKQRKRFIKAFFSILSPGKRKPKIVSYY